jgi:hypothetical protein
MLLVDHVDLLVCSAASGADLLALDAARDLSIRCRVVLPFQSDRFRSTSVIDRSWTWAQLYDSIIPAAEAVGDLVIVDRDQTDEEAYEYATTVIIKEAKMAAAPKPAIAIVVWDGSSRGENDYADQFRRLAQAEGMRERVILTR